MFGAFFAAWDFPPLVCAELALVAVIYTAGFLRIRVTRPLEFPGWRWWSFICGILALVVAVSSPLDTFSDRLLVVHMGQHFVLMSVAPPLIVLGAPVVPMLRGLPRWFVRPVLGPLIRVRQLRGFFHGLVQPKAAWLLMNLAYVAWHIPAAYEAALANENIHNCEHACFFFTSVLFWWPIIEPWPSRFRGSRWILLPYLLAADIVNTVISASLVFAGRLVYPSYGLQPRMLGISPLADQAAAGAFMWVIGSIVFLIPAFAITMQLLSRRNGRAGRARRRVGALTGELHDSRPRISRL
jgi:cytochrome c oxidase assembly factor CtaG